MTHVLFSYGTLRQPQVQRELFGRVVPTVPDHLVGHRVEWLTITDAAVIATSGSHRHPVIRPGDPQDTVAGHRLELSDAELECADAYEVDDYTRVAIRLASGLDAWVYMAARD